jgi:hypothetical protein
LFPNAATTSNASLFLPNVNVDDTLLSARTARTVSTVTSTVTLAAAGDLVVFIGAGGVVTLPTAVGNPFKYTLKNIHTVNKSVATTSSQTIDGSLSVVLTPNTSIDVVSDGTVWRVI